jgi:uncharacterized protein (TIGR03435 family)
VRTCHVPTFVCAALILGGIHLAGQAPPPPPPPPAPAVMVVQSAPTGSPPGLPPTPAPIGLPLEDLPSFEVASVKKLEGRVTSTALRTPGGGRITIVNLPLRTILMQAFGIRDYQIVGGPGWMVTDRFTINAKAEDNAPRDQLLLMLRSLLVERFQLAYRAEQRDMQVYVLTTAGAEWTPTDRMREVDCSAQAQPRPPGGAPLRMDQMPCGGTMMSTNGIQARGVTMASFATLLGSLGGLGIVHNRTGLTGTYHIELEASPAALLRSTALLASPNPSSPDNLLPNVGDGRSLGSAVRDLGLRLERRREPVDVLVIDSVSQPDED